MLFVQETAKSRAELLVKTLDDKDQGKMPVMLIYGEKDVDLTLFYSKIIVHILHTVLYTFPIQGAENLFYNQELLSLVTTSFIPMTWMCNSEWYCKEKLDASHF